jgi:hypothetical protein
LFQTTNPYLTGMPQVGNTYNPYFAPSPIMPAIMGPADPTGVGSPLGVVPQTVAMPQKMPRTDRLEVCLPANYMRQVAAAAAAAQGCHGPRAPPPPQVYQAANGSAGPQPGPQSRVSPVSTMQSQCSHNQSPSPTVTSHVTCTSAAALTPVATPLHNQHPGPLHNPLHNLVYVHAYYEGSYVPIYVRT